MALRALLVTSEFPPDVGGIGSHVAELAKGLAVTGSQVKVVHPRGIGAPVSGEVAGPVSVQHPALVKAEPFYQMMLGGWLGRAIARDPVDLVHVHGVRPLGATRNLGVPVVFTNHSSGFLKRLNASPGRKRRTRELMRHVAHVIGPSAELVEAARTLGYSGPATMIPNGVDPDRFSPGPSSARTQLGIAADEVVILLARRLVDKNGVVWFARALQTLRGYKVRIIVAGDGPERAKMGEVLGEIGLVDRVTFLGAVANSEMPALFRAADLSVLPSLAEATSIAGLEAMASGLPLVGTRVGGIPAIVEEGVTGLLVPPRDPAAMGAALVRLASDSELRQRMGQAARARVEREFTWTQVVERTIAVYRASLGARA